MIQNDTNSVRGMFRLCASNKERIALAASLHVGTAKKAECVAAVKRGEGPLQHWVGNEFCGFYAWDFCHAGKKFRYMENSGPSGTDGWRVWRLEG